MTPNEINRQIAKYAARNVYKYAAQFLSKHSRELEAKGMKELDARLLAEAIETDKFYCSEEEMNLLLRVEYARIKGQTLGGIIRQIKKKHLKTFATITIEER